MQKSKEFDLQKQDGDLKTPTSRYRYNKIIDNLGRNLLTIDRYKTQSFNRAYGNAELTNFLLNQKKENKFKVI